jgi:hypothetical protein
MGALLRQAFNLHRLQMEPRGHRIEVALTIGMDLSVATS